MGDRYAKFYLFCPKDTIEKRSKEDRVPYQYWADMGYHRHTRKRDDYDIIEETINTTYHLHKVIRLEYDRYNATQLIQGLQEQGLNVSEFSQAIGTISAPTKEFEKLVYSGKIKHDGNPAVA
jgi:phage terminase large subunit-like protein